jgi:hypothetical protein
MTEHTTLRDSSGDAWVQEPLAPELGQGAATPRPRGRDRWWVRRLPSLAVWPAVDGAMETDAPATDAESED